MIGCSEFLFTETIVKLYVKKLGMIASFKDMLNIFCRDLVNAHQDHKDFNSAITSETPEMLIWKSLRSNELLIEPRS